MTPAACTLFNLKPQYYMEKAIIKCQKKKMGCIWRQLEWWDRRDSGACITLNTNDSECLKLTCWNAGAYTQSLPPKHLRHAGDGAASMRVLPCRERKIYTGLMFQFPFRLQIAQAQVFGIHAFWRG
jgi:hypothetical protein